MVLVTASGIVLYKLLGILGCISKLNLASFPGLIYKRRDTACACARSPYAVYLVCDA